MKKHKSYIKMLPLSFPFNKDVKLWQNCVKAEDKITPIMNRNGFFLNRKTGETWLEINYEAWKYQCKKGFLYILSLSPGNNRIHPDVFEAIKTLMNENIESKKQREMYSTELQLKHERSIKTSSSIRAIHILKNINISIENKDKIIKKIISG